MVKEGDLGHQGKVEVVQELLQEEGVEEADQSQEVVVVLAVVQEVPYLLEGEEVVVGLFPVEGEEGLMVVNI